MGDGMNLSDDEIKTLILALYYYQQEFDSTATFDINKEVVDIRDKLEDYLLSTQSPEDAKISADFMKALARLYA